MIRNPDLRILISPTTQQTAGCTLTGQVDCAGYDYLTIIGTDDGETTHSAAETPTELRLGESPTAPTAWADVTAIPTFEGGVAATDATHGFVIGTSSTNKCNGVVFNVDLRGRQRYILMHRVGVGTHHYAAVALLFKQHQGQEAAVATTTLSRPRNVVSG